MDPDIWSHSFERATQIFGASPKTRSNPTALAWSKTAAIDLRLPRRVRRAPGGPSSRGAKIVFVSWSQALQRATLILLPITPHHISNGSCDGRKRRRPNVADHGAYVERWEDPIDYSLKISWTPGAGLSNALFFSCFRSRRTIVLTDLRRRVFGTAPGPMRYRNSERWREGRPKLQPTQVYGVAWYGHGQSQTAGLVLIGRD